MQNILLTTPPPSQKVGNRFIREVPGSEFITYGQLSTLVNLSAGALTRNSSPWLHFNIDGVDLFVSKLVARTSISWNNIKDAGLVYGSRIATIGSKQYKVRLLKGADADPFKLEGNYYEIGSRDSEWDTLFNLVVKDDPRIPIPPKNPDALYTMTEVDMGGVAKKTTLCQEISWTSSYVCCGRGYGAMSGNSRVMVSSNSVSNSWRPCLELVE